LRAKGKKLQLKQKKFLSSVDMNFKEWLVYKNTPEEVIFINRKSGKEKVFNKKDHKCDF
jgi:hypothetical protein